MGDDLLIMVKNHREHDSVPYRKVELNMIDPNSEVPEWELTSKILGKDEGDKNQNGKRSAPESPEGRSAPKRLINDWQLSEFLWAYLEGMQTTPRYDNLQWELEEEENQEETEREQDPETNQENEEISI